MGLDIHYKNKIMQELFQEFPNYLQFKILRN